MTTAKKKTRKTPTDKLPGALGKLAKLLMKSGRTAQGIADRMGCSKPTAYARVRALRSHGWTVNEERVREGAKGPESALYSVRTR